MAETTTQIVKQGVSEAIEPYQRRLLESAWLRAGVPLYAGITPTGLPPQIQIAGLSPMQQEMLAYGRSGIGGWRPYMQGAGRGLSQAQRMTQPQLNMIQAGRGFLGRGGRQLGGAGQYVGQMGGALGRSFGMPGRTARSYLAESTGRFDPRSAQRYMNPYTQNVVNQTLGMMEEQGDVQRRRLRDEALRSGAFGGSRAGIARAKLEGELQEAKARAIAPMYQQGYSQSLQAAMQEQARRMGALSGAAGQEAQLGTAATGTLGQQSQLMAGLGGAYGDLATRYGGLAQQQRGAQAGTASLAQQLAQLGQSRQGMFGQDIGLMSQMGGLEQRQMQAVLDAQRAMAQEAAGEPFKRPQYFGDILAGVPSGQTSMATMTQPSANPFAQGLGAIISAGAVMNPWAQNKTNPLGFGQGYAF